MANYQQPDFRIPASNATILPPFLNGLALGTPIPHIEHPDYRVPPPLPQPPTGHLVEEPLNPGPGNLIKYLQPDFEVGKRPNS